MSGRFGLASDEAVASDEADLLCNEMPPKGELSTLKDQRERAASKEKKEKEASTGGRWGGRLSEKAQGLDSDSDTALADPQPVEGMATDPLTSKGNEIMKNMQKQYGEKKGKSVFYASKNKGTISGVDLGGRHGGRPSPHL